MKYLVFALKKPNQLHRLPQLVCVTIRSYAVQQQSLIGCSDIIDHE